MSSTTRLFAAAFWAALAFAVLMATQPQPPIFHEQLTDKGQHLLAFAALTPLARLGFPRLHWSLLFLGLALAGALIELLQMIPAFGREATWADLGTDLAATGAVLLVCEPALRLTERRRSGF